MHYEESSKQLPVRRFDVVVAGAGTAGVVAARAELEFRRRQEKVVGLFRRFVPGCQKAFIARTSPSLCIRRGRCLVCDYDITIDDVLEGRHFADDVMAYGFHDSAPRLQIKDGGT